MKTSFVFVFRRRIDQDEYVRLSLQGVFKTSWSRPIHSSWPYVFKTSCQNSSRRFQDILHKRLQNIFKTSSKHLQDLLPRRLQDVFKKSSRRLAKTSSRNLQDIFKTSLQRSLQRRFQDVSSS